MLEKIQSIKCTPYKGAYVQKPELKNNGFIGYGALLNADIKDTFVHSKRRNPIETSFDEMLVWNFPTAFLNKYANNELFKFALSKNPRITEILSEKNVYPRINIQNVTGKNKNHFITTYLIAKQLGAKLPKEEQTILLQAALLHDVGKAFIPSQILDKPGKLTPEEKDIVDTHAEIGKEILKITNLDPRVIKAIDLHHTSYKDPKKSNNEVAQILSVADVYSALKEERAYKTALPDSKVKEIMESDSGLNHTITSKIF